MVSSSSPTAQLLASIFFFFNDTATTEIYTLSLHDALPISRCATPSPQSPRARPRVRRQTATPARRAPAPDRKSTRLNSSHSQISYAVFCLKKKKTELVVRHNDSNRLRVSDSPRVISYHG